MNDSDLVVVSRFRSVADAEIAQGILNEVSIESMIRSDNAGGMIPALDEAELLVRAEESERAAEALARPRPTSETESDQQDPPDREGGIG